MWGWVGSGGLTGWREYVGRVPPSRCPALQIRGILGDLNARLHQDYVAAAVPVDGTNANAKKAGHGGREAQRLDPWPDNRPAAVRQLQKRTAVVEARVRAELCGQRERGRQAIQRYRHPTCCSLHQPRPPLSTTQGMGTSGGLSDDIGRQIAEAQQEALFG